MKFLSKYLLQAIALTHPQSGTSEFAANAVLRSLNQIKGVKYGN